MRLPTSNRQGALVPWRPRRDDPQARRFHSSAVPVTVDDSWSAPTKTNGLKNPIGGLSGPRLEDAAGRETRDEQECIDDAGLVIFPAQDQNGVAFLHVSNGCGVQAAIPGAGHRILSHHVDRHEIKVDWAGASGAKIAKLEHTGERFHRFYGAGETAEPAGDDQPGSHGWHSRNAFAADVDGVSGSEGLPTAADGAGRLIGSGWQYPERNGSRGVDRNVRGSGDTHGNSVVGRVQSLHGSKEAFSLPADQFPLVSGVNLGTGRYPYAGGHFLAVRTKRLYAQAVVNIQRFDYPQLVGPEDGLAACEYGGTVVAEVGVVSGIAFETERMV